MPACGWWARLLPTAPTTTPALWSRAASRAPCCTTPTRWPSACCGWCRLAGSRPRAGARWPSRPIRSACTATARARSRWRSASMPCSRRRAWRCGPSPTEQALAMRWLPLGSGAVLLELDDLAQAMALHRQLLAEPIAGVAELVPAARTLLLKLAPGQAPDARLQDALRARWERARAQRALPQPGRVVEIAVRYDGADLPEVAEL